ncbi:MAG: leucine-rich repeat domain-containing protein [Roseburia sp.]|nr:leucine-rich repeat domain-containing protein [Anaeroplasma bactoclasticum]MCM1195438.1 leucine-rich repeat domain-containing protein [Roseburia sp.]
MLKKLIQSGKWKLIASILTAITVVSAVATLSIQLAVGFSGNHKTNIDSPVIYDDDYFDDMFKKDDTEDHTIPLNCLIFQTYTSANAPDGKTAGLWLIGIDFDKMGTSQLNIAKYCDEHALLVPDHMSEYDADVVGVDLTQRSKDSAKFQEQQAFYSLIKGVSIPDTVLAITTGSFNSMSGLEYLKIPFVGTSRGSSGRGMNYTIQQIQNIGGRTTPTSDSLGSMFGKPFEYTRATNTSWSPTTEYWTDYWYDWRWNSDKSGGTFGFTPNTNYGDTDATLEANTNKKYTKVYGTRWVELSDTKIDETTGGNQVVVESQRFNYLIPRSLQRLIITDDTAIGNNALTGCTARMIDISTFNGSALIFGNYAISECEHLTNVKLPTRRNVSFRKGTFNTCQKLESVILPPALTEIPEGFLYQAINLKAVVMPASISNIDDAAFNGCTSLEKMQFYSGNSSDGIKIDLTTDADSGETKIEITGPVTQADYDFEMPRALQYIGANAFRDCQHLVTIDIPDDVKTIGYGAFAGCYNINTMTLPFIGAHRGNCGDIESGHDCAMDNLGGSTDYHGLFGWIFGTTGGTERFYSAYQSYDGIEGISFAIPKTLENIYIWDETVVEPGALQNLQSLINLTVNERVGNNIAVGALNGCSNLKSLSISSIGNHLGDLFKGAEFENSAVTKGDSRIPISLENIAITNQATMKTGSFDNCSRIKNVTIGNNTQVMESALFYNNESLETLTIPFNGYERGEFYRRWWWWGDKAIRNSVSWLFSPTNHPNTYSTIAVGNWSGYIRYIPNKLTRLTVTDETEIDTYAFRNMKSLESISITNIPNLIDEYSFYGCSGLQEVQVPYIGCNLNPNGVSGYNHTFGWIFGSSQYADAYPALQQGRTYYIPEKLANVKIGASGREQVNMSNKVFDQAFMNCKNIADIDFYDALINDLGNYAFANCSNLSQVHYPKASYTKVGDYAFYNCSKVLAIEDFTPSTVREIGNYSFNGSSVGKKNLYSSDPNDGELVLDKFSSVGDYAFGNCLQIRKVDLPVGLTSIGNGLFSGCSYLEEVIIDNNPVVTPYMFENCTSFTGLGLDLGTIVNIPEGLFSGCVNLKLEDEGGQHLEIGDQTISIGKYAFRNCSSLGHYVLPSTLTTIEEGAFQGCVGMDYMTIPRSTTVIDPYGWNGCNNNFFFYVYEPEANWPEGWVTNWNCDYPVYILGEVADDIYTYHFDTTERKFYITGLKPDSTLNGIVTIPNMHNGIQVIGIDETIDDYDENPDRKSISTQTGITKVIIPKSITRITGSPFATGSRVDIYFEYTKSEIKKIYDDSYANLEKQQERWMREQGILDDQSTEAYNHWQSLLRNLKGWIPAAESAEDGVCYGEQDWVSYGIAYYKDYWQYGTGVTYNVPYLNIATFKYTLSQNDNHYTSGPIYQNVVVIQMPGELYSNDEMGVNRDLLIVGTIGGNSASGAIGGRPLSPDEMLKYTYYNNVNVGTATIEVTVDEEKLLLFNRSWTGDLDNYPGAYLHALYLTGKTNLHYTIQKSQLVVRSISGSIVEKIYDGKPYSYSNWVNSEISGLEAFSGATFSGRVETRSENVGLYTNVYGLYWASPWRVYLNGRNITDNFDVTIEFSVNIVPQDVELVWIRTEYPVNGVYQPVNVVGTYNSNGKTVPLVEYPYIGGNMKVYAIARNIATQELISPNLCPITTSHKDSSRVGIYPYTDPETAPIYGIYGYVSGSAARNYNLLEKQQDGTYSKPKLVLNATTTLQAVEAAYRVCKGLITISINETYKIPPTSDYWSRSYGFSGSIGNISYSHASIDGLGDNSIFLGSLKTSSDALDVYNAAFDSRLNNHTFEAAGSSLITWTNLLPGGHFTTNIGSGQNRIQLDWDPSAEQPYLIFNPNLRIADEAKYYDVVVNARIQILYNDFNLTYFVGVEDDEYMNKRNPDYIVYPQTITENTDGNMREYEYIRYMVDGKNYRLTIEDWNSFRNSNPEYQVFYYKDDGTSYDQEGPIFKEIGEYVYAVQVSGRHYNTLRKNIRLQTVKSNVEVASLSKVYDRDPVDPLGTGKILKAGEDQRLAMTFTYFDVNGNRLSSAPANVGTYSVQIYAPEGAYFNEYNRTHTFTISKRRIDITISGNKTFDQQAYSYTPLSADLARPDDNPDIGLLPGDEFVGTIHTSSFEPGSYFVSNTDTFTFVWSPAWSIIYDVDNSNVSDNYNVVVRGKYDINPLIFEYTAEGFTGDYDGEFHTGTVDVTYPAPGDFYPAFSAEYEVKFSAISLSEDSAGWLDSAPVFSDPGEYELYYMIRAQYFKTVIGHVKIKINFLKITYTDPATLDTDGSDQYWTVQYDGRTHLYEIEVISPEFSAVVYYSVNGSSYTTQAPLFLDYGLHQVSYRIEAPYHETVGPISRTVRLLYDINNPNETEEDGKRFELDDFYANFFQGEYDGLPHSVDADFSDAFKALNPDLNTNILYSTDGTNWTTEKPYFTELGSYLVTVKFMAQGYRDDFIQGNIEITGMQLDIQTHPYETVFDGKYHMITLSSNKDQIRFDDTTKTYFYKNSKMEEEVELKFYYTTNPNVVGSGSGWLPTVEVIDGEAYQRGLINVDNYAVYVRIEADNFETLVIQEFTRLTIKRLDNPDISMESPQQFEYSRAPLDTSKIVIDTVADGARSYYFYSAYFNSSGEMKYDEPMNRIMPPEELGLYYVEVRVASTKNCGPATVFGFVQIVPRQLEVHYTNPQYYDGTLKAPNAYVQTGTSDVIHIISSIIGDKEPIEVGLYSFEVTMVENNPNYVLKTNVIEMEIKKRNILFTLEESHLLKDNGATPWTHEDSLYYDTSAQVGDNRWYLLGNLSGQRTVYIDGTLQEVTYSGLAPMHAIYAELETSEGVRGSYFHSTISNEFYINSVLVKAFDIYQIDEQGYFVKDEFDMPISVKEFYDIDYYLLVSLQNPDIDLSQLEMIDEYYYDGSQHSIQIIIPPYLINGYAEYETLSGYYSTIPPSYVNVGDYEIKYRIGAEGYEETYGKAILKIKPAKLNIEVGELYKQGDSKKTPHNIYDDTAHLNDYTITNVRTNPAPVATHRRYYSVDEYSYAEIEELYKNFDAKSPIYLNALTQIKEAGKYYLVVYFAADSMRWDESYTIVEIELKPRDIYLEIRSNNNFVKVYDGTKISIPLTNATFDNTRTATTGLCTNHSINQTTDRMRLYTVQTNSADAGVYDLLTQFEFGAIDIRRTDGTIVNGKNYHPVIHGDFYVEIMKAYLREGDFTVEDYTEKIYDGYRHEPNYTCVSDGELLITYFEIDPENPDNKTEVFGDQKNAGHYLMQISVAEGKNYHSLQDSYYTRDADGNPYFPLPFLDAELLCLPKEVEVNWEDMEQTFTGENLAIKAWILDEETDHDNPQRVDLIASYWDNPSLDWIPTVINRGTYLSLAQFDTTSSLGRTYDRNYTLLNDLNYFTILHLVLQIQLGDGINANNEDTNNIIYYNTQTAWRSELYKEDTLNASEIVARTPEERSWLDTISLSYPGNESLPATVEAVNNTVGTYRGERFIVNCMIKNKNGVDITQSIAFEIIGSVTVMPHEIDFTTKDVTLPYKENKGTSSVVGYTFAELGILTLKNPKEGATITNYVINGVPYGLNFPNISQAGEYDISFDIMATGYDAKKGSAHVTITPFPAYMTFSKSLSKVYDGSSVDVSVLVQDSSSGFNGEVSDLLISYVELVTINGTVYEQVLEEAPVNVGKYKVRILSSKDLEEGQKNYTTLDVTQIFEITAKPINLTISQDVELLDDELLGKAWSSAQVSLNAGDNAGIMSGDLLRYQFSTDIFTRGVYNASQMLRVDGKQQGLLDATNTSTITADNGKQFLISWQLVKTNDKGQVLTQQVVDPSSDPNDPTYIEIPLDVSFNYYINLTFKLLVHYPYIPVTVKADPDVVDYDGLPHVGTIEFKDYTSADASIFRSKEFFEDPLNTTQLYSLNKDALTNASDTCKTSINDMAFTEPGTYTVYYKIDTKDNTGANSIKFEPATGSYTIIINKLNRTVTQSKSLNKEYDGEAAGDFHATTGYPSGRYYPYFLVSYEHPEIEDYFVDATGNKQNVLGAWDWYNISYHQAGQTAAISAETGCIPAGVYMYSITIPESAYYKASTLQGNFVISKIRIYIEDKDFPVFYDYDGFVKTYNVKETDTLSNPNQGYSVGIRKGDDTTLTPLGALGLTFDATLVTRSYATGTYKGSDTSLLLYNYAFSVHDLNGNDVSTNYLIDYSKATMEISPITMEYFVEHPVYTYDNQDHAFSYFITNPSNSRLVTVEWYNEQTSEWSRNPIFYRDVGEHTATIRMFADNYYPVYDVTLTMTIKPAETYIEYVSNLSRVYDGREVTVPEIIKTSRDMAHEGTDVRRYTYRYYQYDDSGNLIPEPIFTQYYNSLIEGTENDKLVTNGHRPVDVGKYRMEIEIPASQNFEAATYSDDFVISSYITDVTWQNLTFTYDGTAKAPKAYLQLVPHDATNGVINIVLDVEVTPNGVNGDPNHINKGTYTATAKLNYGLSHHKAYNYQISTKTESVTFTIQPRSVRIELNYPQSLYKGDVDYLAYYTGLNKKEFYRFSASNLVDSHTIRDYIKLNYSGPGEYNKASDFAWMDGNLNTEIKSPRIYDLNNVDVTDNYLIGYSYYFVLNENITDAAVSITNYVGEYDGAWHSIEVDLMVDDPENFSIEYWVLGQSSSWSTRKPQRMDVGQDQISVRIKNTLTNETVFEKTAGITITRTEPEVQFDDLNLRLGKIYDGAPIANPAISYNGSPTTSCVYTYYKINSDGSASKLNYNPIDAGTYRLDVEFPANQNYNSVVHSFEPFEITPRTITVHISNQAKQFDNLSWFYTVKDEEVENLVRGHTLRLTESSNNGILMTTSPMVGTYTTLGVEPGFHWQNNYLRVYDAEGNEVNGPTKENYVVNLLANVEIVERQFDVDFKDKAVFYTGNPISMAARINGTKKTDGSVDPYVYADFENEVITEYAVLSNGNYTFYPLDAIQRTAIGIYNVRVRISAPNYETLIKEARLVIVDPDNPVYPPGLDPNNPDDPDNPITDPTDPDYPGPNDADKAPYIEYDQNKVYDGIPFEDPLFTTDPNVTNDIKYYEWDYYIHNMDNLDPSKAMPSNPVDAGRYVFVLKISDDALEHAGEEFKQAIRINPRPVTVTWENLTQKYTGDVDNPLLPNAYYLDISGNRVNADIQPATGYINQGKWDVIATTSDPNYVITNMAEDFVITQNVIKDIVLLPPDEDYEAGNPIVLEDTEGNKYIRKKDAEDNPDLVDDPYHTYLIDDQGELWKYDDTIPGWVPADLPYTMDIDDSKVDEDGKHEIEVKIKLKNPGDDSWENNGTDDIIQTFPINPKNLPNEDYDLVFKYEEIWIHTGTPIEPPVTVYLRELATNILTELDPKHYDIEYQNNIDVTTEDSKAEILISSKANDIYYFAPTTQYFTIVASKPDVLELKDDALIQFITANYEEGATTFVEDGSVVHLAAGEDGLYLGHLHQDTPISEIIAQFKNDPEKLIVLDHQGNEIEKDSYSILAFGSGFSVSLLDDDGQIIDTVQGILYGDLNSDGYISDADIPEAQFFVSEGMTFTDVEAYYYFSGVTNREIGFFSDATIVELQGYVTYISEDPTVDFNTFDGTYPATYGGASEIDAPAE